MKNPNVSEEAKEHSQEVLEELEDQGELQSRGNTSESEAGKNFGNFVGGHKVLSIPSRIRGESDLPYSFLQATLKNPRVSEEAKEHSREVLEERDAI